MGGASMKTVGEAAAMLGVSKRRVYALIEAGLLTAEKASGIWLVDEGSLEKRLASDVDRRGGRPRKGSGSGEVRLTLMNRNHIIAQTVYDVRRGIFSSAGPLVDESRAPLGLVDERGKLSAAALSSWWSGRGIPQARKGLADILAQWGVALPEELVYRNLGLSLSDQYWVRPEGLDVTWDKLNFFTNDFERLNIASEGLEPQRHPDNTSDGVLPKHWFVAADGRRMLAKGGGTFSQEPCNEVIATELCRRIMPEVQFCAYTLGKEADALVSLCPNFLTDEEEYVPAHYVRMLKTQEPHHGDYQHYLECCYALGIDDAPRAISYGIVCDDVMANADRHWRNFGIVRNVETLACRIAPIFDTGSSLWCDREDLLAARDFTFSSKQFEVNPGKQLQFADLDWVDTDRIQDLDEYAREVLCKSALPLQRVDLICEGIRWRVRRLTHICEFL